jgi:hypothetical protein
MPAYQSTATIPDGLLRKRKRAASNDEPQPSPQKKLAGPTNPDAPLLEAQFVTSLWSGGPADRPQALLYQAKTAYSSKRVSLLASTFTKYMIDAETSNGDRMYAHKQAIQDHQQTPSDATQSVPPNTQASTTPAPTKKPEKTYLQSPSIASWLSQEKVYTEKTMMCKAGRKGMELFLRSQDVDVDAEYPPGKWVFDGQGEKIARNRALMQRCQQVQGNIIAERNADKAEKAKQAGRTSEAHDANTANEAKKTNHIDAAKATPLVNISAGMMFNGMSAATPLTQNALHLHVRAPHIAIAQNPAMQSDDGARAMLQTRESLRIIRARALQQIKDTRDQGLDTFAAMFFADPTNPIISTSVEQLVFNIVECELRLQGSDGMPNVQPPQSRSDLIQTLHSYRAMLVYQLHGAVKWGQGSDPVAMAGQLVAQEFPARL